MRYQIDVNGEDHGQLVARVLGSAMAGEVNSQLHKGLLKLSMSSVLEYASKTR